MSHAATLTRFKPRAGASGLGRSFAGLVLGAGWTLLLFLLIAHFDRSTPVTPPPDILDARAVAIEEPPPPLPEVHREPLPVPDTVSGLEALASASPVHVAAPPPDLAALRPPPTVAPPATIQVGRLYTDLKPKINGDGFRERIYQMAEVDVLPKVLRRVLPQIPASMQRDTKVPRTTLLFVVDANGEIHNLRVAASSGNEEFDALVAEAVRQWTFSPAVRRGKKVRVLIQEQINIRWSGSSLFSL